MSVLGFDHIALPAQNPIAMMDFYAALGFTVPDESLWRDVENPQLQIFCGSQRINLHEPSEWQDPAFTLRGPTAQPGCGDLCFVWGGTLADLYAALERAGAPIIEGPVPRRGGRNLGQTPGQSVYIRDPDQNLVEFILYA